MSTFSGRITEGSKRATALGFPTVNIALEGEGVSGVYAAHVTLEARRFDAVAFADPKRKLLEAHVFDFSEDAYGKDVEIELLTKLRDSMPFENDGALKKIIAEDAENAKAFFKTL